MERNEDRDAVKRVLDGDTEAYRTLVARHQERIFYLGLKFFRNPADAEDFAQDVFVRAFEKLGTYAGSAPFSAWLYRLAYNLAVNQYRVNTRVREFEELEDEGFETEGEYTGPEEALLRKEHARTVSEAVRRLPEKYMVLIKMHFFDGLSYPDISEILEVPINTIKSYVHRAKKQLREALEVHWG